MAVTVETARGATRGRLIALVQPHRYSRVQALWRELGASVAGADLVVVTDVYGAAQEPIPGVTGELVVDGVRSRPRPTPSRVPAAPPDVVDFSTARCAPGDLVVTMGCGDVWMLGDAALERHRGSGRRERRHRPRRGDPPRRRAATACARDFSMAPLTTFRIGGPAALFLEPESEADLAAAAQARRARRRSRSSSSARARTSSCPTRGSPGWSCGWEGVPVGGAGRRPV